VRLDEFSKFPSGTGINSKERTSFNSVEFDISGYSETIPTIPGTPGKRRVLKISRRKCKRI